MSWCQSCCLKLSSQCKVDSVTVMIETLNQPVDLVALPTDAESPETQKWCNSLSFCEFLWSWFAFSEFGYTVLASLSPAACSNWAGQQVAPIARSMHFVASPFWQRGQQFVVHSRLGKQQIPKNEYTSNNKRGSLQGITRKSTAHLDWYSDSTGTRGQAREKWWCWIPYGKQT